MLISHTSGRQADAKRAGIEVTPEMACAGADALFPDAVIDETADELEVMARVFRAMVTGRDPRLPSYERLCELLGTKA